MRTKTGSNGSADRHVKEIKRKPRPELCPRERAVTFTDARSYYVSESSGYGLLRSPDLITSRNFIVMKAADEFRAKATAPNQPPLIAASGN